MGGFFTEGCNRVNEQLERIRDIEKNTEDVIEEENDEVEDDDHHDEVDEDEIKND